MFVEYIIDKMFFNSAVRQTKVWLFRLYLYGHGNI